MENRKELKRFLADIRADRELFQKVEEIGRRMVEAGSDESNNELVAKAAAELGYSITAAELERAEAAAEELDDDQLEEVSGGSDARCDHGYDCSRSYGWVPTPPCARSPYHNENNGPPK